MTYRSRGRSTIEMVLSIGFSAFLFCFIAVLCVGNYLRASRAGERQRHRRIATQERRRRARGMHSQATISFLDDTTNGGDNPDILSV